MARSSRTKKTPTSRTPKKKSNSGSKKRERSGCSMLTLLIALAVTIAGLYLAHKHKEKNGGKSEETELVTPHNKKLKIIGIDISHNNGKIDWKKIKKEGVSFAYIKSTQGLTHLNRRHTKNYNNAKDEGITAGFYHFFMFEKSGEKQAKFFLENSQLEGKDLPPAVDIEYSPPDTRRTTDKKKVAKRIEEIKKYDSTIYEETGVHPVIYANKECYRDLLKGNFPNNDIWICDISNSDSPAIDEKWTLWQYSQKGELKGINGKVDMDVFNGNEDDFKKWIRSYQ